MEIPTDFEDEFETSIEILNNFGVFLMKRAYDDTPIDLADLFKDEEDQSDLEAEE